MPRRRRRSKARPIAQTVEMFICGDGVTPFWGDEPLLESEALARRAWDVCRARAWRQSLASDALPPKAAVVYDGIGESVLEYHPSRAGNEWRADVGLVSLWDPAEARRRLRRDVRSVERFRERNPEAAREIADELDEYVTYLGLLVETVAGITDYNDQAEAWWGVQRRVIDRAS